MIPAHGQFEIALKAAADTALKAIPEGQRVHYAMNLLLDTTEPSSIPALSFAAKAIKDHADKLSVEAHRRDV